MQAHQLVEIRPFPGSINPTESVWENFQNPTFGSILKNQKMSRKPWDFEFSCDFWIFAKVDISATIWSQKIK